MPVLSLSFEYRVDADGIARVECALLTLLSYATEICHAMARRNSSSISHEEALEEVVEEDAEEPACLGEPAFAQPCDT